MAEAVSNGKRYHMVRTRFGIDYSNEIKCQFEMVCSGDQHVCIFRANHIEHHHCSVYDDTRPNMKWNSFTGADKKDSYLVNGVFYRTFVVYTKIDNSCAR